MATESSYPNQNNSPRYGLPEVSRRISHLVISGQHETMAAETWDELGQHNVNVRDLLTVLGSHYEPTDLRARSRVLTVALLAIGAIDRQCASDLMDEQLQADRPLPADIPVIERTYSSDTPESPSSHAA